MKFKTILAAAAVAGAVLFTAGAADAANIKFSTGLYANPGWDQVGWVHSGQWVDVQGCDQGYCYVSKPGQDGFVKAYAIDFGGYGYPAFPPDYWHHHHNPWGGGGPGACIHTPGFGFCLNP